MFMVLLVAILCVYIFSIDGVDDRLVDRVFVTFFSLSLPASLIVFSVWWSKKLSTLFVHLISVVVSMIVILMYPLIMLYLGCYMGFDCT